MALARVMEGEMDRALEIVGLKAREFVALLEIAIAPFPGEGHLGGSTRGDGTGRANAPTLGSAGEAGGVTQRELGSRLALTRGGTSELLGRLQRRRLIARGSAAPCARAGRRGRPATGVTLTRAGDALLRTAAKLAMGVYDDWARRLAVEAAGADRGHARANGLKRWLTESLAALRKS